MAAEKVFRQDKDVLVGQNWLQEWYKRKQPRPPLVKNILLAFFTGGFVCLLGQLILKGYIAGGIPMEQAGNATVVTVVFTAALLTGLGVFDKMAQIAGAGLIVPVTGFANSITSMAIEYRREGLVLGTGSRMFGLAGSVIVFGAVTAFVVGLIAALAGLPPP